MMPHALMLPLGSTSSELVEVPSDAGAEVTVAEGLVVSTERLVVSLTLVSVELTVAVTSEVATPPSPQPIAANDIMVKVRNNASEQRMGSGAFRRVIRGTSRSVGRGSGLMILPPIPVDKYRRCAIALYFLRIITDTVVPSLFPAKLERINCVYNRSASAVTHGKELQFHEFR
jgi:hypothetical protein